MGNIFECFKYLTNIDINSPRKTNKYKPVIINKNEIISTIPPGVHKINEEKDYIILNVEDFDKIL